MFSVLFTKSGHPTRHCRTSIQVRCLLESLFQQRAFPLPSPVGKTLTVHRRCRWLRNHELLRWWRCEGAGIEPATRFVVSAMRSLMVYRPVHAWPLFLDPSSFRRRTFYGVGGTLGPPPAFLFL